MNIQRIIVVGCGGTGSMLSVPLIRYLKSISYTGQVLFIDGDKYAVSNSDRQNFNYEYIDCNKAKYQSMAAVAAIPDMQESISCVEQYLDKKLVNEYIIENTLVINCTDNLAARKIVEDKILTLKNAAHINCGNEMKRGQVQCHIRQNGKSITPSIYKNHPEFNSDVGDRAEMDCAALSKLPSGGQIICSNMMAAALALNYVYQLFSNNQEIIPSRVNKPEVVFNVAMNEFTTV